MSDTELRALERRWAATPYDQEATLALIGARRRAGLPVPARLLDARVIPGRRVAVHGRYAVRAELPDGSTTLVGKTGRRAELELPAHRSWSLEPTRVVHERDFRLLLGEARELQCPALRLELGGSVERPGERLARLDSLERLDLAGHGHLRDGDVQALAGAAVLHHLSLRRSFNVGAAAMSALERLERLVHLDLEGSFTRGDGAPPRLERLPVLESLVLDHMAVRAAGVSRLRSAALRSLSLRGCRLGGRAGRRVTVDLRGLPSLAALDLTLSDLLPEDVRSAPRDLRVTAADPRLVLDWGPDGCCPVQAGGTVAGQELYFRARGRHWSFTVGDDRAPLFEVKEPWDEGPYDAGYMPVDEAERLLLRSAGEFLSRLDRGEIRLPGAGSAA